jgi:hypothetical protein
MHPDDAKIIAMLSMYLCDIVLRHGTKFTFHVRPAAMLVFDILPYKETALTKVAHFLEELKLRLGCAIIRL